MSSDFDPEMHPPGPSSREDSSEMAQAISEEERKEKALPPQKKSKSRSFLRYIIVMFSLALLLLLLSFFMQQRNHTALMEGLSSSKLDAQTLLDLEKENADLETKLEEAESQLSSKTVSSAEESQANEWLLTMWYHYQNGNLAAATDLLEEFQALGLSDHLSSTPLIANTPSPLEIYQTLNRLLLS